MFLNNKYSQTSYVVQNLVEKYSSVLSENYQRQEKQLLSNLYEQAKVLKQELQIFKREVSNENIEKLINQKRREKQKQRQILENRWRQCNQSFKALQQQQKKLTNEQKEYACDVTNLKKKIEQFRNQITSAYQKSICSSVEKDGKFITETKQNQHLPYKTLKNTSSKKKRVQHQKSSKILKSTSNLFFSNKYSLNKFQPLKFTKQTKSIQANPTESSRFENSYLLFKGKSQRIDQQTSQRQNNLQKFLNDPSVRLKLFKIVKKQL